VSLISLKQAGAEFGYSGKTIRRWIALGYLRGYQPGGGKIVVYRADVERIFKSREVSLVEIIRGADEMVAKLRQKIKEKQARKAA